MAVDPAIDVSGKSAAELPVRRIVRRRQRRMAAILAEAATELAQGGYWAFNLEAVAERLDLSKTSLYHYFPSRDALVAAVLEDVAAEVIAQLEAVAKQPGLGYQERLRALIVTQLTILLKERPEATSLFVRPREWPEEQRDLVKTLARNHDRVFRAVVREGVQAGELRPVSVPIAIQCMHGAIKNVASEYHDGRSGTALSSYIGDAADTILMMFTGPAARATAK